MKNALEIELADWYVKQTDPELQIKELFRNYNISTELIKRTTNQGELLDLILEEYINRFDEIPGIDLVRVESDLDEKWHIREKLRSLVLFATQAVLLHEKAEVFRQLEDTNQKLSETTEKLSRKTKKLKEMNKQYLNMLGFVSHELRSPLISILGFAELLEEGILGTLSDDQRKAVQVIIRSSNSLIEMIQNYLDLAKIEQGELKLEKNPVDLYQDILLSILEEMDEQFQKKEVTVYVQADQEIGTVFCDSRLIRIVLNNLLSNAIKYGESGGEIGIQLTREDKFVQVTVANTGEGMKKKELRKIFQKFSQMSRKKTDGYRSSGLGLYNSRYIVRKHGGNIWAESEPGKWFQIHFTLPVLEW